MINLLLTIISTAMFIVGTLLSIGVKEGRKNGTITRRQRLKLSGISMILLIGSLCIIAFLIPMLKH